MYTDLKTAPMLREKPMRSFHHLQLPVLRGRDHLNRRLTGLLPHHTTFVLLDVFQANHAEEENVLALREAAHNAPLHLQVLLPCGPDHAMLLLAATPPFARQALDYALSLAGNGNLLVFQDGLAHDRLDQSVPGHVLDAASVDIWAKHLGVDLRADGMFDRTACFLRYAAAMRVP